MWVTVSSSFSHKSLSNKNEATAIHATKQLKTNCSLELHPDAWDTIYPSILLFWWVLYSPPWRATNPFSKSQNAEKEERKKKEKRKSLQKFNDFKNNHTHKYEKVNKNQEHWELAPFDFTKFYPKKLNIWIKSLYLSS